jgi:hypothetical protein
MAAVAKPTRTFLADKYFPVPLGTVPYLESIGRHLPNLGAGGLITAFGLSVWPIICMQSQ